MSPWVARPARAGWLILPTILSGLVHVLVLKGNRLPRLTVPLDGGRTWRGHPIFGPNKTWRGVLVMAAFDGVFTGLQASIERKLHHEDSGVARGYRLSPWAAGSLVGLAYCVAELPNSFAKRRLRIPPGGLSQRNALLQYGVDQIDSAVGCALALRVIYRPQRGELPLAMAAGFCSHVAVDQMLYRLGVKRWQ